MKRSLALVLAASAGVALVLALTALFRLRVGAGDVFPEYSSLRADPLGVRALHDSLAQIPALTVERNLAPLDTLSPRPPRTIILAGVSVAQWHRFTWREFDALDAAVRTGSRVVIALRGESYDPEEWPGGEYKSNVPKPPPTTAKDEKNPGQPPKNSSDPDAKDEGSNHLAKPADLGRRWGAPLASRSLLRDAERAGDLAIPLLPERRRWESDLYFTPDPDAGWRVLYRRGTMPVLIERPLGAGTIVLATDSYLLSNEALQRDRSAGLLAWLVGPNPRVVFDESHLGVEERRGLAALARHYGLGGAFATLVVLAALFVWRQAAVFVPATPPAPEIALSYHPAAGLEQLLHRSLAPTELGATCVEEWRRTARPADQAQVDAALRTLETRTSAAEVYNTAVRAVRRR